MKQVLVFYDGPQLALLESDRGHAMLAVAVTREGYGYPMFAVEILGNYLEKYLQGKADLRYVFASAPVNRLYFFDLTEEKSGRVLLTRATSDDAANELYYPLHGIFSRSHTHPLEEEVAKGEGKRRFLIDGKWEATDFSGFYGKIADTYALMYISESLETLSATESDKLFLQSSINEKNWQGGGSYGSFYGGMRGRARSRHPLKVEGIEYHSPGYIDVLGNIAVLNRVDEAVQRLIRRGRDISKLYKAVYKSLKNEKLLRADKTSGFANESTEQYTLAQSYRLAAMVGLSNPESMFAACDNNVIVFAKVVLSFSRRVRDLTRFYVEGRVRRG
ncbi:hypothetical protein [Bradyrhizobium pachyrhizi]|nr:hypothetical protein [Bradyrhizobium pachyrhizi]